MQFIFRWLLLYKQPRTKNKKIETADKNVLLIFTKQTGTIAEILHYELTTLKKTIMIKNARAATKDEANKYITARFVHFSLPHKSNH